MGTHPTHNIHANSEPVLTAIRGGERNAEILRAFDALGAATDREIKTHLGFTDMNQVRPEITIMVEDGRLLEVSRKKCATTGRPVRICRRALA